MSFFGKTRDDWSPSVKNHFHSWACHPAFLYIQNTCFCLSLQWLIVGWFSNWQRVIAFPTITNKVLKIYPFLQPVWSSSCLNCGQEGRCGACVLLVGSLWASEALPLEVGSLFIQYCESSLCKERIVNNESVSELHKENCWPASGGGPTIVCVHVDMHSSRP